MFDTFNEKDQKETFTKNEAEESCSVDEKENKETKSKNYKNINEVYDRVFKEAAKYNRLCVSSAVLTFISFFAEYYVVIKTIALLLGIAGLVQAIKEKQRGKIFAIASIVICSILIFVVLKKMIK